MNNTENEKAILAAVLRDPSQYEHLADIVNPTDFSWHCYGWAWEAMKNLQDNGFAIDAVTVGDELMRMGKLDEFCLDGMKLFSARAAISKLKEIRTKPEAAESYALIINDYAVKRELLNWASQMATWAQNGRQAAAIMADVESAFSKMVLHSGKMRTHTFDQQSAVARAVHATEQAAAGIKPIQSGLVDLDKILGGFHRTDLIVVAARPGVGKTAFLLTCMLNAMTEGKKPLLFSIEMGVEQVTNRIISQLSGVPASRIRDGNFIDSDWSPYYQANETLSGYEFIVNDMPAISIGSIRVEARRTKPDIIFVDYIQLAEPSNKRERRDQDIGEVTRGLKALAKELDIPVIAAAQLNRAVEARSTKRPNLGDLRESGDIENDADVVIFLWKPDEEKPAGINATVEKYRHGPKGTVPLFFHEAITKFGNAETQHHSIKDYTV